MENVERNVERSWHEKVEQKSSLSVCCFSANSGRFIFKKPIGPLESKSIRYNVELVAKCNTQFEDLHKNSFAVWLIISVIHYQNVFKNIPIAKAKWLKNIEQSCSNITLFLLFSYYERKLFTIPNKITIKICASIAAWTNWATSGRYSGPTDLPQQWLESNSHREILTKPRFYGKNQRRFPRMCPAWSN